MVTSQVNFFDAEIIIKMYIYSDFVVVFFFFFPNFFLFDCNHQHYTRTSRKRSTKKKGNWLWIPKGID